MNGATSLVKTLASAGVEVCFANPGTSEMHFVAALDQVGDIRCVLGLFEGVVTGAADGYARMADKPALTLLHLGPGFANGLANVHNARRANAPMVNIVGDHATYHKQHDAPLTSDVEGVAKSFSDWVRTSADSRSVARDGAAAVAAAMTPPGRVATLILPADASWNEADGPAPLPPVEGRAPVAPEAISQAARVLRSGEPAVLFMGGHALREPGLMLAGRIAAKTGASARADPQRAGGTRGGAGRCRLPPLPGRRRPRDPRQRTPPRAGRLQRAGRLLRLPRQAERADPAAMRDPHPSHARRGHRGGAGGACRRARRAAECPRPGARGALTILGRSDHARVSGRCGRDATSGRCDRPRRGAHRRCGFHVPDAGGGRARLPTGHRRCYRYRTAARHRGGGRLPGSQGDLPAGRRQRDVHGTGPVDPGTRGPRRHHDLAEQSLLRDPQA